MTPLDRLAELEAAATPAPWQDNAAGYVITRDRDWSIVEGTGWHVYGEAGTLDPEQVDANLALIAEARNALPGLIEEIRTLRAARLVSPADREGPEPLTRNDLWWHERHALHDDAHHQAHAPLDLCVPLWSNADALRWRDAIDASLNDLGLATDERVERARQRLMAALDPARLGQREDAPLDAAWLTTVLNDWVPDGAVVSVGLEGESRRLVGEDLAHYIVARAAGYEQWRVVRRAELQFDEWWSKKIADENRLAALGAAITAELRDFLEPMGTEDPTYRQGKEAALRLALGVVEHLTANAGGSREFQGEERYRKVTESAARDVAAWPAWKREARR